MTTRLPLFVSIYDDGSVKYEVAIVGEGEGEDEDGRPIPLPPTSYVAIETLPPGISNQIVNKLNQTRGL